MYFESSLEDLGFPNYSVTSMGDIYNIKSGYKLKGTKLRSGYYRVYLTNKDVKSEGKLIHVLVASAFLGVKEGMTVDHINRDRSDNRLENLRWATRPEQNSNKTKNPTHKGIKIDQYDLNGNLIKTWDKIIDASRTLNIPKTGLCKYLDTNILYHNYIWKRNNNEFEKEEWKLVPYENIEPIYASNYGRIKKGNGRITEGLLHNGYYVTSVYDKNTKDKFLRRIHRLVASAFFGLNEGLQVNHKDGDRSNNKIENLEFVTARENSIHAVQNKLRDYSSGHKGRICKVAQYDIDGNLIEIHESIKLANKKTGISNGNISEVCKGRRNKAGGYIWRYI